MRFIHTGDIHLGATPESKRPWAANRGDEIWNTLERLIKKIKIDPVDLLIIAGDMFHRQPLLRELKEVDYLFSTIPDTKVVLCAGNHDAIKKGSFYDGFKWSENVIFLGDKNIESVEIPELNTCVYGLSYHQTEIKDAMYDHVIVDRPDMINILVAHGGDEKHIPINRKKLAMSGFDYVAMGHIHKPEIDEKMKMAYSGSLEPIDMNDIGPRGYIDVSDIEGVGNVVSVIDNTVPDYDFEELYAENKDNILGMYIKKFLDRESLTPLQRKTLYYGTKALMDAMEDRA